MKLFTEKVTPVSMAVLLMAVLVLTGCTMTVQPLAVDAVEKGDVSVANLPAPQKAWAPSYYRDDLALIGAVKPTATTAQRLSPSYYLDDPDLVEGHVDAGAAVEQRWGPSYYRDDPSVIGVSLPGTAQ